MSRQSIVELYLSIFQKLYTFQAIRIRVNGTFFKVIEKRSADVTNQSMSWASRGPQPATWQYPVYSYLADHQLFAQCLMGHHLLWT
jgi:hypothetical protein